MKERYYCLSLCAGVAFFREFLVVMVVGLAPGGGSRMVGGSTRILGGLFIQ